MGGGLYLNEKGEELTVSVLVPFDIGVVYINITLTAEFTLSFSPLRYWGGLYHELKQRGVDIKVLVPFDIGVVYIS